LPNNQRQLVGCTLHLQRDVLQLCQLLCPRLLKPLLNYQLRTLFYPSAEIFQDDCTRQSHQQWLRSTWRKCIIRQECQRLQISLEPTPEPTLGPYCRPMSGVLGGSKEVRAFSHGRVTLNPKPISRQRNPARLLNPFRSPLRNPPHPSTLYI
jgi:hypothetical protein